MAKAKKTETPEVVIPLHVLNELTRKKPATKRATKPKEDVK